jgi:hypothetical protein
LRRLEWEVSRVRGTKVEAHRRGRLLSGVALSMMLAACDHRPLVSVVGDGSGAGVPDAASGDNSPFVIGDAAIDAGFDFDAFSHVCGDGGRRPLSPGAVAAVCCGSAANGAQLTFNDAGIPIALTLSEGGTASDSLLRCVLQSLASYCYPSLAGTTQPVLNSACWIA